MSTPTDSSAPSSPAAPTCPKCGASHVPRSQRRGFREAVLLRMLHRAPYRCGECGERFVAEATGRPHRHRTLAGYMGIRDPKLQRRFHQRIIGVAGAVLALVVALALMGYCTRSTRPPEPGGGPGTQGSNRNRGIIPTGDTSPRLVTLIPAEKP